jgi:hypothetical protein
VGIESRDYMILKVALLGPAMLVETTVLSGFRFRGRETYIGADASSLPDDSDPENGEATVLVFRPTMLPPSVIARLKYDVEDSFASPSPPPIICPQASRLRFLNVHPTPAEF